MLRKLHRRTELRILGLRLADMVMEGTFFLLQIYLTDVFKLNFTTAAAILNIWGGIYRILPAFFLFLADTLLGHFKTLVLSGMFSTSGLVLVTLSALPVYRCEEKDAGACGGHKERALFITGMVVIALGRSARFASAQPFMYQQYDTEQNDTDDIDRGIPSVLIFSILVPLTSIIVNLSFPYAKKWYLLFGVSAIYTASATVFFLSGFCRYRKFGVNKHGSHLTDIFRVFVAAAFKISQPYPTNTLCFLTDERGYDRFSSTSFMRFLDKAAIILPNEEPELSWRLCSLSQVEFTKQVLRMFPLWCSFIMCGVVSSTGSTYFVEQINNMKYKIGAWEPPTQGLLSLFLFSTIILGESKVGSVIGRRANTSYIIIGGVGMMCSILCCTVAAAVEKRRLHVGASHHLLDQADAKIPMNAGWIFFQVLFLALQEGSCVYTLTGFNARQAPVFMKGLQNYIIEGVTGVGYMYSALLIYVVGKISERGGNNSWFQATLNTSRLDRYYWVLAALSSVNLLVFVFVSTRYKEREYIDQDFDEVATYTNEYLSTDHERA